MGEDQLISLVFWGIVLSFLVIFVLGLTNRVVVFSNGLDVFWSLSPLVFMLVSVMLAYAVVPEAARVEGESVDLLAHTPSLVALWLGLGSSVFGLLKTVHTSIRHNGLLLGLVVGVFKIMCSMFIALLLVGKIADFFDEDASIAQRLVSVMVFGVFLWILNRLINGDRVLAQRAQAAV